MRDPTIPKSLQQSETDFCRGFGSESVNAHASYPTCPKTSKKVGQEASYQTKTHPKDEDASPHETSPTSMSRIQ